ncbi:hypothetical protein E4T56_gene9299 [Termitomyces sp. T112]|nr:hypothetical protein E4T56_gene9299 [Termitomyces sp. T112]
MSNKVKKKKSTINTISEWATEAHRGPRDAHLETRPFNTSYAPCLRHGLVALASSQTQPHFVRLGPRYSTQCFIPDPTSLHSVRSLYFELNAKFQTQPHFVRLGPCISNSMLSSRTTENIYTTLSTHIH